ncbi:MAG: ThuA domain-containing protein [Lunatimonas sp.]|uniref:ThuA domain-containing protein n=1 Tax=Lunatimonas sp. TaxID=2060141 RepID=UPI00263ACF90|nr:ThuA domain-containing protein [Lunatimonas sp.]MCC5936096.1 ThuA domain-containing protein [Lunatimonas sp.]
MNKCLKPIGVLLLLLFASMTVFVSCTGRSGNPKVLVFSKTAGYYHQSIPDGIAAILRLGAEHGFDVDTTKNAAMFTEEILKDYDAVIFLSTTGDVLDHYQQADFERYIQAGGGFVGIHAAADTEYDWPWFAKMVGGNFLDHPGINDPHPNVQDGMLDVVDRDHPTTRFLPEKWGRKDEWYSYKNFNEAVNVLITLDEDSYQGGVDMGYHPIAWYHEYDGGRAFYTGGGHTSESFTEELFLKHILEGIQYAIGKKGKRDYSKAVSKRVPEEDRFEKTTLASGVFTEPVEMAILPNLDILVAQRRGEVLLYKQDGSVVKPAGLLDVYWRTDVRGVNAEEGLLGLQIDPNFATNRWVYLFYSPTGEWVNRLSRFKFENDELNMASEQVILEFYSQRDICCHTGGSIAFDKDGLLYVSAGDNATPFNQANSRFTLRGYAPIDDRPGREQYDAARSSGNSNDLRGKILRIKVNEDGSYDIPEGNLYPKGQEGTRPEIYVQGNRNPYRISVDKKTGYLYWGEVGPDARADSLGIRGPMGYDEVNQAKKAGNFGWPFFVGDNYPYTAYNFDTGESGITFDPQKPVNISRNNTGIRELPPAQPAFIWYPYVESAEFPQVGTGGRNAMAGPVYYSDLYPNGGGLPDYFDGKLFIYEWIRGWVKVVTMDENGDYEKMEPFMPGTRNNALIDMELGPDGKLYYLEYGNGWFSKNPDAALSRIDYNPGNRAPVITSIRADNTSGALPFEVNLQAEVRDPEKDKLSFQWDLGNGEVVETSEPTLTYTFNQVGDYAIRLRVTDTGGLTTVSQAVEVYAGNITPLVQIKVAGNQSFYFPGQKVNYEVNVDDPDDPSAASDLSSLYVVADYMEGFDQAEASMGHQVMTEAMAGKSLMESLTCKTCHKVDEPSIGPAYLEVVRKYRNSPTAEAHLINKIMKGGSGVWGETMMPANPDVKEGDAKKIIAYIRSLADESSRQPSLPAIGSLDPTLGKPVSDFGTLRITATYTDKGGQNIKPLTGGGVLYLRNPKLDFASMHKENFGTVDVQGRTILISATDKESWVAIGNIDLTGVQSLEMQLGSRQPMVYGYQITLRKGSSDGAEIASKVVRGADMKEAQGRFSGMVRLPFASGVGGKQEVYLVVSPLNNEESVAMSIAAAEMKAR